MKIVKDDYGCFTVKHEDIDLNLPLDFRPLINWYSLNGHFCILHYQARPKPGRQYGIYDSYTDQYYSPPVSRLQILATKTRLLQIDERSNNTQPTAAMLYPDAILEIVNGLHSIRSARTI